MSNDSQGARLEVEGEDARIDRFLSELVKGPPGSSVASVEAREIEALGDTSFTIVDSVTGEAPAPSLPADMAPCEACLRELEQHGERRFGYPFTNCTRCGPRYTIAIDLPYDRERTTMNGFPLCEACAREYGDPEDRRFHAQPIACPRCGPHLRVIEPAGDRREDAPIVHCARRLREGRILALQGVGGFQLLCDARGEAVVRLRERKRRPHKPLAVMFPSMESLREHLIASVEEEALLRSAAAPIVLLDKGPSCSLSAAIAPGNGAIGAMLPSSPLHHLLLREVGAPLVCTSGNLANEPLCTAEGEALERLAGVADLFLVHDRPIARPVDDSVTRWTSNGLQLLRRARGYVPLPLPRPGGGPVVLALGGHLKSTIALAAGDEVVMSQHLGDLDNPLSRALLERTVDDLLRFFDRRPEIIACDRHPDYASSLLAEQLGARFRVPVERVSHHHAHVAACIAEHGIEGPVLGLAWDGVGLGDDGDLWGGEALRCEGASFSRIATLRPFHLPGGETAIREPRRSAIGMLHAMGAPLDARSAPWFPPGDLPVLSAMLDRGVNAPRTTSIGRLFDAVAALLGLPAVTSFEGQAAIELESLSTSIGPADPYPLPLTGSAPLIADWAPLLHSILADRDRGISAAEIGARFHASLAALAVEIARRAGLPQVALTGGCFQNRLLVERTGERLTSAGFRVFAPSRVPPNDGGLSLGQTWVATRRAAVPPSARRW
ncbi:MAG: carbamoyltransferase HypF [Byssovorax sp.]